MTFSFPSFDGSASGWGAAASSLVPWGATPQGPTGSAAGALLAPLAADAKDSNGGVIATGFTPVTEAPSFTPAFPIYSQINAQMKPLKLLFEEFCKLLQGKVACEEPISQLRGLLGQMDGPLTLNYAYHHHKLHDLLTDVTLKVLNDSAAKEAWYLFLTELNGTMLVYPDKTYRPLDCGPYLDPQFAPQRRTVKVEKLNATQSQEICQIAAIASECFGLEAGMDASYSELAQGLKDPKITVLVASDEKKGDVLGYVRVLNEAPANDPPLYHIHAFGRRANAAKRGVAHAMMTELFKKYVPSNTTIWLEVRTSNEAAIKCYKQFGFEIKGLAPFEPIGRTKYYSNPDEDAYKMVREGKADSKKSAAAPKAVGAAPAAAAGASFSAAGVAMAVSGK